MEVVVEYVIKDGIERTTLFSISENHNAEILLWHEHHARDESAHSTGMPDQLAAVIVTQSPTQGVSGKVRLQSDKRGRRISNRKNCLCRQHLARPLFREQ